MIPLTVEIKEDIKKASLLTDRGFNRLLKKGLKQAVLYWHRKFARLHFQRVAYSLYFEEYQGKRKNKGEPLVQTGTLRQRVLRAKGLADVKGTAKSGVTLRIKYGRPPQFTEERLRKQAFYLMRKHSISFQQAMNRVYSNAGYGKKNRKLFQERVTAVTQIEARKVLEFLREYIVGHANSPGPKRRRKVS